MSGSNITNELAAHGTEGTSSPNNVPGARWGAVSYVDAAGDIWIFGGSAGVSGLNDLWEYEAK
jgi:hypothetical protein